MNGFDLVTGAAAIGALSVIVLLARVIGPRSGDVESLFRASNDLGWPRGVQEEDLVPWRVELLGRGRRLDAAGEAGAATAPAGQTRLGVRRARP
jgi:hypothetical protein